MEPAALKVESLPEPYLIEKDTGAEFQQGGAGGGGGGLGPTAQSQHFGAFVG